MSRRKGNERVHGPYRHGNKWRLFHIAEDGSRSASGYATEDEALKILKAAKRQLIRENSPTVELVLTEYREALRKRGLKAGSIRTTLFRLEGFFAGKVHDPLVMIEPAAVATLFSTYQCGRSVDTYLNTLAYVRAFYRWAVENRYVKKSPVDGIKGEGRRRRGKQQLRIDEARKWLDAALEVADAGDAGCLAATLTLLCGLRAGEIAGLSCRDVDDGGRVLWVAADGGGKTINASRRVAIPETIRARLLALVAGRNPTERLFKLDRHGILKRVKAICEKAGVVKVTAHGMRGLHATLAVQAGAVSEQVAASLGHHDFSVTKAHYASAESVAGATQESALNTLLGHREKEPLAN